VQNIKVSVQEKNSVNLVYNYVEISLHYRMSILRKCPGTR